MTLPSLARTAGLGVLGALLALVVAATGALAPSPAVAAPTGGDVPGIGTARTYWGAISISRDATATYSYDYRSKGAAKRAALRECKRRSNEPGNCRVAVWVGNGCAAVAALYDANGYVTRYNWGVARSRVKAKREAVRKLGGGRIAASVCTSIG